jgi:hypothetical protein
MTNVLLDAGRLDTDWLGDVPLVIPVTPESIGTTLYLRDTLAPLPHPIEKQSSDTIKSGTAEYAMYTAPCLLSSVAGTNGVSNTDTDIEPGVAHYHHLGTWVSAPLDAQTISGTITIQLGIHESAVGTNSNPRVKIYKWLANGTFGSDLLALTTSAIESNVLNTHSTQTFFLDAVITTTDFSAGDKLVIEIEVYTDNALINNQTNKILFNGASAEYLSYISFSQTLLFSDILLTIGDYNYPFLDNTLSIENVIGQRGLSSFKLWDDYLPVSRSGLFALLDLAKYIICNSIAPPVGTKVIFTGNVPAEITAGTEYYVVYSGIVSWAGTWNVINVSATKGGAVIDFTWAATLHTSWDEYVPYSFSIGENINVYNAGEIVWSGVIDRINKRLPTSTGIQYTIQGISWNYALDKRRVVGVYTSDSFAELNAGAVVEDLIDKYLSNEGISTGVISSGVVLNTVVFNYIKPSQALDALAEQSGYIWQITPDKQLDFKVHDSTYFPFNIGSSQIKFDSIQYIEGSPKYRNVQYIIGGMDLTSTQNAYEYGDSEKQTFTVPYSIMQTPSISEVLSAGSSGVTKSVGILGVDTTHEYFWNKYSKIISQNSTDSALTSTEQLRVEYIGGFPSVAQSYDAAAISTLQSVEGGSGIVEDAFLKGKDSLFADNVTLAGNLLSKYSTVCDTLQFRTREPGISPGKILKIDIPDFGLSSEEFLVDSVKIRDEDGMYLWFDVKCVSGYDYGGWSQFFDNMITRTIEKDIWEGAIAGDVIVVSTEFAEGFTWTEGVVKSPFTCPLVCAAASTDTWNIYPNIADEPRVSTGVAGYPC